MGINVLSCFDGISCGQLALKRAGIEVNQYFASEIDKYAIKITQKNFPSTIQLGDIQNWKEWNLPKIDLILAGSPCQGFSNAGKGLNFEDSRSKLFFTFCDILAVYAGKNPNLKYLLENVKMKKEWRDIITDRMKVEPVLINSALVSAQNRQRLYWANWKFGQPEDKYIYLKDIIENGEVDREKSYTIDANYYKGGNPRSYFEDGKRQLVFGAAIRNQVTKRGVEEQLNIRKDEKSNCVVPSYPHKLNGIVKIGDIYPNHAITGRVYSTEGKSPSLISTSAAPKILRNKSNSVRVGGRNSPAKSKQVWDNVYLSKEDYRGLTVLECERLQTLPEGYTEGVSNTRRYAAIGNGWTVDVISHILSAMPR